LRKSDNEVNNKAGGTMAKYGFFNWKQTKENIHLETSNNIFTSLPHNKGDLVYFGIHDLSKGYRANGQLPTLSLFDIFDKKGEITNVDPIRQTISLSTDKPPFNYGYRKLETDKTKRFMRDDGKIEIKIPAYNLQNITHIMEDDTIPVWLVIDGNTNYQKELMKAIRRNEIKRIEKENLPQQPVTRHYDQFDGDELCIENTDNSLCSFDPSITSKTRVWKQFQKTARYRSYPKVT
jgi:hypothetical protein